LIDPDLLSALQAILFTTSPLRFEIVVCHRGEKKISQSLCHLTVRNGQYFIVVLPKKFFVNDVVDNHPQKPADRGHGVNLSERAFGHPALDVIGHLTMSL
jgi:hypothetical protein